MRSEEIQINENVPLRAPWTRAQNIFAKPQETSPPTRAGLHAASRLSGTPDLIQCWSYVERVAIRICNRRLSRAQPTSWQVLRLLSETSARWTTYGSEIAVELLASAQVMPERPTEVGYESPWPALPGELTVQAASR
jgi:hypothetical protein